MEPTEELLTANEAVRLSNQKPLRIQEIAKTIKNSALNGDRQVRFYDVYFSTELISEIIKLGYSIQQVKDFNQADVIKISW